MSFPTFQPKRSRLAARLMVALFCATPLLAQAATPPVQTLAYPAGSAQTQTIRLPWSGPHTQLPALHTQQVPTGVTLQLRGWTPHQHALRVAVSIPARLAPGLYAAQFTLTPAHGSSEPVSLRLAVQALYIGLSGGGGAGIVIESTDGKILTGLSRRFTAGIPEQGKLGVSGIGYDPLNETLWIYAGGVDYITNVVTLNGQFLPSPIPRHVIGSAVPSFIGWAGGHDFLWAREDSWILTNRGATASRIHTRSVMADISPSGSERSIIPSAATVNPQTGTVYLSNGDEQIHSSPWIYEFTRQGQYLGHFTDPQFAEVMALACNPWNQKIYVLGRIHGTPSVAIHVFTAQGQPVALPAGAFPGGRLLATPVSQTVLSANPLNGHLYYLNRRIIHVYSPFGRLLRTLPSPAGAHNITFVPGYLNTPTAPTTATAAPTALTSETAVPQPLATPGVAPVPQACPPGYRCVPKSEAAASPAPSSPAPSFNQSVNYADNTVNNVDNLASSISDLAQAFR